MSHYLVDTDWLIEVLHGTPQAVTTLSELADHGLASSLITYGELFQGAYYARQSTLALTALHELLAGVELLPLTTTIMERFAILRGQLNPAQLQQIGDMDLLIAATALEHDLTLVSFNQRDYALIPDLRLHPTPPSTSTE